MEQIIKRNIWNDILKNEFENLQDIYFNYDYFELFAKTYNTKPEGIYWEDKNLKIFWTHLIREISRIKIYENFKYFDLVTPYGYGGPLIYKKVKNNELIENSIKQFYVDYRKLMEENGIISEFVRFHPVLKNWEEFERFFDVKYSNQVIILDLSQRYEDIWKNMEKKTRYYTNKALKEFPDVYISHNPSEDKIKEFILLYKATMDKNRASEKYYFSKNFIKNHFNLDCLYISCNNKDGITGAISLFLKGHTIMHYHLSATNDYFKSSPSRAVLWSAIEWAKEQGLKWFHFGGGVGIEDSLYRFKRGFSKTQLPFHMGRIIHNSKIYNNLASLNPLIKKDPNFFPLYRVGMDKNII